jgi:hypothetical protein
MTVSIGTLSYAAAAAAYCFLSVLLIVSWRGRIAGALLTVAALSTAALGGYDGVSSHRAQYHEATR